MEKRINKATIGEQSFHIEGDRVKSKILKFGTITYEYGNLILNEFEIQWDKQKYKNRAIALLSLLVDEFTDTITKGLKEHPEDQ